jgi:hypothetical protein
MDSVSSINREIFKAFKARGLSLQADASKAILSVLLKENDKEGSLKVILSEIKDRIEKKEILNATIDLATITSIVSDLSSTDEDLTNESTQLFDSFSSPKLEYDERLKSYKVTPKFPYQLHSTVESRARMYRERLVLIQQRLMRSKAFILQGFELFKCLFNLILKIPLSLINSSVGMNRNANIGTYELSTIDSLLGFYFILLFFSCRSILFFVWTRILILVYIN